MSKKASATVAPRPMPTLEHVDPQKLVIGTNVRLDPRLDKELVNSIKEMGVLTPIVGHRDGEKIVVDKGQRRTLAAVQTGRGSVPVMITESPDDANRLVEQLAENDHRLGVTNTERVAAYEQLAALGMSAAQIAKRTARSRTEVDAALKVSASEMARKATQRWDFLTLDQAAALSEFEGDGEAVKELVLAAQQGGFDHRVQRLRDQRAEQAERTAAEQALAETGLTVIARPGQSDTTIARLDALKHGDELLTEETHRSCPGHAAFVTHAWHYVDEDDLDEETDSEDEGDSAEPQHQRWAPVYVCTDHRRHGHEQRYSYGAPRKKAAEMSDGERETARAARRDVINSNKEWDSAEKVRLDWLRAFLTRRTAPKGTTSFMAQALLYADQPITNGLSEGVWLALDLFSVGERPTGVYMPRDRLPVSKHIDEATEGRALLVALGLLLASYERMTRRDAWRNLDAATMRYLRFLQAQGYELSTVERRACGELPKAADDSPAASADESDDNE